MAQARSCRERLVHAGRLATSTALHAGLGRLGRGRRTGSRTALHVLLASSLLTVLALGAVVAERERSRRALRARLRESEEHRRSAVEAATRATDELLAAVSHELRTPLQAMLAWTKLLQSHADEPATVRKGIAVIERNVRAQAQLIDGLRDVSRVVAGKLRGSVSAAARPARPRCR